MKKLFCLLPFLLLFYYSDAQVARCNWMKVAEWDSGEELRFIDNRWTNNLGNPLQFLITKCECRCNKEVVMTGIFQFTGPAEFGVFHHILTVPAWLKPAQVYFGETQCSTSTTNWPDGYMSINQNGEVFLTFPVAPLLPGTIVRVTMIFYIP